MNERLLLVKGITLLYRESQLEGHREKSSNLIREIISTIKLPEQQLTLNPEVRILGGLRDMALSMANDPVDHEYEQIELLQRIKVIAEDDDSLYDAFKEGISTELEDRSLKRTCLNYKRSLQNFFREGQIKEILNKASASMNFRRDQIPDMKQFVAEVLASLEPYQVDAVTKDPAIISQISFSDPDSMKAVMTDIKKEADGSAILQTGYQGINRMFRGGFRRGDQVVIGALQHNYKTGFSLSLFKQIALYNTPSMIDPDKKPLLLRISFEDDINLNFRFLYSSLVENETGRVPSDEEIMAIDEDEVVAFVRQKMLVNGYHIEMLRVDPTKWTYLDICNKVLEFESEGYEVHVLMLDYLKMIPTTGCTQGPTGSDIRDMYRRMRNFTNPRKITCITPHQLSTEAKMLVRDGHEEFVKKIANKGYYDGCRTLDQEVDIEMYIHIEKDGGNSYLTIQRGKHRIVGKTPDEYLYCVLPFTKEGGILDDINGPDSTRKKVGGGAIGTKEENPWWDFNN